MHRWLLISTKNTPDSKNTQNRPSFSCGLHYVKGFTGWPILNNAVSSFENLAWRSELNYISTAVDLLLTNIKQKLLWYDINDLAKTAFLSLTHFTSARGSKIVFSCKCQQKEWSSEWTVHYLTVGEVSKCLDFTVLWLVQKIDHWLELTSSITFIWLLVASKRTVPRSFRGKYAASFSVT